MVAAIERQVGRYRDDKKWPRTTLGRFGKTHWDRIGTVRRHGRHSEKCRRSEPIVNRNLISILKFSGLYITVRCVSRVITFLSISIIITLEYFTEYLFMFITTSNIVCIMCGRIKPVRPAYSKFCQEALGLLQVLKFMTLNKTKLLQINFSGFNMGKSRDNTINTDFFKQIMFYIHRSEMIKTPLAHRVPKLIFNTF